MRATRDELAAALRDLPDDWGSWLVYADALTEAGDERGQLLVLEHQHQAVHALAEAWMHSWRAYVADEDVDVFRWLSRFTGLATRAPAALAPIFGRPISQLVSLLELADDPPPRVSRVFAVQRDRILAATRTWIERAFDGVPAPDAEHLTIYQAEAADSYAACDRSRDHLGRWQELPDEHVLDNQWALAHLDEQGMHYYLPAVMTFALRHFHAPHARDTWITESLGYTLQPSGPQLRDYQRRRFSRFDREQRAAICAFVLATGTAEAIAAWARVFEAEHDVSRADWYAIFTG